MKNKMKDKKMIFEMHGFFNTDGVKNHVRKGRRPYRLGFFSRAEIEANSITEAIDEFHLNYDGANCGTKYKALWIETSKYNPICVYPKCSLMYRENKSGRFSCGTYDGDFNPPGCILNQYDPPEDCPVHNFLEEYSNSVKKQIQILKYNKFIYHYVE